MRLRYFIEAAKYKSFTVAAEKLYTTQPNLSKQISLLEQELGVQVFHRTNRSLILTRAGQYLFEQLQDIPDRTARAFEQARAIGRSDTGVISVGIIEGQEVNTFLLDRIHTFAACNPTIELNLERRGFSNLRQGLNNKYYDVIITFSFEAQSLPGALKRTIRKQTIAIAINRKNPLAGKENLNIHDLKDEPFVVISPEESPGGYSIFLEQCAAAGFTPKIARRLNNLESLLLCVEVGIGVAIIDRNTRLEKNEEVRTVTISDSIPTGLCVFWLEQNPNPVIPVFVERLCD